MHTIHPMLLPVLVLSNEVSFEPEFEQRRARYRLERIEKDLVRAGKAKIMKSTTVSELIDLDRINGELVDCYALVLRNPSLNSIQMIESMEKSMKIIYNLALDGFSTHPSVFQTHRDLSAKVQFYKYKLLGIENYAGTTLQRLDIQRGLVSSFPEPIIHNLTLYKIVSLIAQRDGKLNYKIAVASKLDSSAMKTISILGIVFLPGTFIAVSKSAANSKSSPSQSPSC